LKPLITRIAALALLAASLSAHSALKPADLYGEPARAPSAERAAVSAVPGRTVTIDARTKQVNVTHFEVIRFVSGGREFRWYFNGVAQPGPLDLRDFAPAGFVDHRVTVYISPASIDLAG
jgi:hypothetical protein